MGRRQLVSMREYAKLRKVSAMAVSKAVKAGRVTLLNGKIDVNLADRQWSANTQPGQKSPKGLPAPARRDADGMLGLPNSYADSRAKREAIRAKREQIEFDEMMGLLVDAGEFRSKFLPMIADAKTRLLGVASKCKARLPGLSAVDVQIIEDLIREALGEIANGNR
jgi:phage terminase Nu1 subunit (DNA packaging protein)